MLPAHSRCSVSLAIAFVALLSSSAARGEARRPRAERSIDVERAFKLSKAPGDTIHLYGGPGSLEGTFQTAGGVPDPQGWISVDRTQRDNHWSVAQVTQQPFDGYEIALQPPDGSLLPGAPFLLGRLGETVASLGDINGDGWTDLAARYRNAGGTEQVVAVYLGSETPDPNADGLFAETPGGLTNAFGQTIAAAGDINDDGYDDVLVANPTALQSSVSLYLGGPVLDNKRDALFEASALLQNMGHAMGSAGDVNNDGADDFLVAARSASLGDQVVLRLGGASGLGSAYTLQEGAGVAGFGSSLAGVGDVNGDGFDDFLVGHPAEAGVGRAYLYFGGFLAAPTPGLVFTGANAGDALGASVAGAGDVNGDGFDDFLIGVPGHDVSGAQRGATYLYFGGSTVSPDPAFVLPGLGDGSHYGSAVAALGDLNGDGLADFMSADPLNDAAGTDAGAALVVFGATTLAGLSLQPLDGSGPGQEFGARIASAIGFHPMGPSFLRGAAGTGPMEAAIFHAWPTSLPGNHWIKCGLASAPSGWANPSGYGNDWAEAIHVYSDVPDPGQATALTLRFLFDCSLEDGWDFFIVEALTSSGPIEIASFSGTLANQRFDEDFNYAAGEYVTNPETGNPAIHLRLRVETDGLGSDEDGVFDSSGGAVAIDLLSVWMDGSLVSNASWEPTASKTVPGDFLFEGFDHGGWAGDRRYIFGDFAKLISNFEDLDPTNENVSPQWAFLDDGTPPANDPVGLSTGGSFSPNWSYGVPSGAVVNYAGGVDGGSRGIWNEIRSPAIVWDDPLSSSDDDFIDAELSFDVYRHLPFDNGIFYYWGVRSRIGGSWSEWNTLSTVYYSQDPEYARVAYSLAGRVPAVAESIQVRIGVTDLHEMFSLPGGDATPGPLFDDVEIYRIYESFSSATTVAGGNVEVTLGDLSLTFDDVQTAGTTSVSVQGSNPNPPAAFMLATDPARFYEVSTDAEWTGSVEVCIHYDPALLTVPEEDLRIRHWQDTGSGPAWVDVTSSQDLLQNIICGTVSNLSPFVLVAQGSIVAAPSATSAAFLHPAHPNPFNPETILAFTLAQAGRVDLRIFDARGRQVIALARRTHFAAGTHEFRWTGRDDAGRNVSSGTYFAQLTVEGQVSGAARRLVLVK